MSETPKEKTLAALQQLTEASAISPLQALRIAWDGGYAAGYVLAKNDGGHPAAARGIPEPHDKPAYLGAGYAIGGQPNPHRLATPCSVATPDPHRSPER